jgi:hypothetical protein
MLRLPTVLCASALAALFTAPLVAQTLPPPRSPVIVTPDPSPPVAEWWKNGGPRIRLVDDRIKALFRTGLERSGLLRELVERVDAGNVVVYIGLNLAIDKSLAGSLAFVGDVGSYRYLRVAINPNLRPEHIIASLAHELQHVLEVVAHPEVRSEADLLALYRRIGHENRVSATLGWETAAAQQVSRDVRRELYLGRGDAVARRDGERRGR